jgi:dienelactone hydrolase
MPEDIKAWEGSVRAQVRNTLLGLLGDLPPRPDPRGVKVTERVDKGSYILERFEFHNGVDMVVPGILTIPKAALSRPAPAILALHHYGSNKEYVCIETEQKDQRINDHVGTMLVDKGYVVAAIDGYFHGQRVGAGPGGKTSNAGQQEMELFKLNLWLGRSLWGLMVRDDQCLLDYVVTRPEVDKARIGATGMSMGCMRAHWLAALDDRVKVVVGVACFVRYSQIASHGMKHHSVYLYVPGMLKYFDTEVLHALIAPRPHLELCGDHDELEPLDGIMILDQKTKRAYELYGRPDAYRCLVYENTGHQYLPEMKTAMLDWFARYLPVETSSNRFPDGSPAIH